MWCLIWCFSFCLTFKGSKKRYAKNIKTLQKIFYTNSHLEKFQQFSKKLWGFQWFENFLFPLHAKNISSTHSRKVTRYFVKYDQCLDGCSQPHASRALTFPNIFGKQRCQFLPGKPFFWFFERIGNHQKCICNSAYFLQSFCLYFSKYIFFAYRALPSKKDCNRASLYYRD